MTSSPRHPGVTTPEEDLTVPSHNAVASLVAMYGRLLAEKDRQLRVALMRLDAAAGEIAMLRQSRPSATAINGPQVDDRRSPEQAVEEP